MILAEARHIADTLVENMRPFCERIEIAGSIRREKPDVKDIEIVAIPKWGRRSIELHDLFGTQSKFEANLLHEWAMEQSAIRWIKPGTSEIVDWRPKVGGKYWRGLINDQIKLDLFLCEPYNWGMIFLIRTGSAEFSQAVVTHAKRIEKPCVDGFLRCSDQAIETHEEEDVFAVLGLEYVEPKYRIDRSSLRLRKAAAGDLTFSRP